MPKNCGLIVKVRELLAQKSIEQKVLRVSCPRLSKAFCRNRVTLQPSFLIPPEKSKLTKPLVLPSSSLLSTFRSCVAPVC